jgi:hypothetical protein
MAMETLRLRITQTDVWNAQHFKIRNPILFVLQGATRTLWHMRDDGFLQEAMQPYRVAQLPADILRRWREYSLTGCMAYCEFDLDLKDTRSLISNLDSRPNIPIKHQVDMQSQAKPSAQFDSREEQP